MGNYDNFFTMIISETFYLDIIIHKSIGSIKSSQNTKHKFQYWICLSFFFLPFLYCIIFFLHFCIVSFFLLCTFQKISDLKKILYFPQPLEICLYLSFYNGLNLCVSLLNCTIYSFDIVWESTGIPYSQ